VENYLLIGDVSLDRDKNKALSVFDIDYDNEFELDNRKITATTITNTHKLNSTSDVSVVMRMHFVVHTYLNLFVSDEAGNDVIGYQIKSRNGTTM
jgi:hypothetical protein